MDPADKWLLMQTLGDKPTGMLVDGDVVSAVEFDHKGDFLATGDRGGRVRIYEKCDVEDVEVAPNARRTVGTSGGPVGTSGPGVEYRLWHEFQSHEVRPTPPHMPFLEGHPLHHQRHAASRSCAQRRSRSPPTCPTVCIHSTAQQRHRFPAQMHPTRSSGPARHREIQRRSLETHRPPISISLLLPSPELYQGFLGNISPPNVNLPDPLTTMRVLFFVLGRVALSFLQVQGLATSLCRRNRCSLVRRLTALIFDCRYFGGFSDRPSRIVFHAASSIPAP